MKRQAKAPMRPIRQSTQYNCMTASMAMCLETLGIAPEECSIELVNKVMGARPMKGASWEDALACAQHFGCRAMLTVPATIAQLKSWTDAGKPVMIAWNPEGRDWSHASAVYNVTDGPPETLDDSMIVIGSGPGMYVWVADPNIPNPKKLTRIVHEDEFYGAWYEKWPNYLVRRPACVLDREITTDGHQVVASVRDPSKDYRYYFGCIAPKNVATRHILMGRVRFGTRSPNQAGSAAMLKRQGLLPVDVMYGEAIPHRRALVMPGDGVQDRAGKLWLFVGTDEDGKAILAKDERELEQRLRQLIRDRLHFTTATSTASKVSVAIRFLTRTAEPYDCYRDGLRGRDLAECYMRFPGELGPDDIALIRRYFPGWSDPSRGYGRRRRPSKPRTVKRPTPSAPEADPQRQTFDRRLTEKQLKAVRHQLYKNRMKGEADQFRMAAEATTVADRFLGVS